MLFVLQKRKTQNAVKNRILIITLKTLSVGSTLIEINWRQMKCCDSHFAVVCMDLTVLTRPVVNRGLAGASCTTMGKEAEAGDD